MVLGVYWYYGFPEGLYEFEYFKWKPGYGGHANNPAELECFVQAEKPDKLLQQLHALIEEHKEGFILVYRQDNKLKIGTGSFHLHDYDFLLIKKVEELLRQEAVAVISQMDWQKAKPIRIFVKKHAPQQYPRKKFLEIVSSGMGKYNEECALLRMDCFVPAPRKSEFITALDEMLSEENVGVFYYKMSRFEEGFNLMLFFTNSRQGIGLQTKQRVNISSLEDKAEKILKDYDGSAKHRGGWDAYPKGDTVMVKMVDEKFIPKMDQ